MQSCIKGIPHVRIKNNAIYKPRKSAPTHAVRHMPHDIIISSMSIYLKKAYLRILSPLWLFMII